MSGKSKEDMKIVEVNGYRCHLRYGINDRRAYLLNNCLKDYMAGKEGLLRVIMIGIYGSNYIESFGGFISYYLKRKYDYIEDIYVYTRLEQIDILEENLDEMEIYVTLKKKITIRQEMELNTILVKLFTNQMLKNLNDSDGDIKDIYINVLRKKREDLKEDEDVYGILKRYNHLENFFINELKYYPDILKFFIEDGDENFEEYEEKCLNLFERIKKTSNLTIEKK